MKLDNGLPILPPELREAVDAFAADDFALLKPFLEDLVAQPPPPLVYHYTDVGGLRGILGTGKLWLTNAFQLNDPSELYHGYRLMLERFAARFSEHPAHVEQFALSLWKFSSGGGIEASAAYFVGSFSTLDDDLDQWRRYADDGCGYALAFDTHTLEQKFAEQFAGRTWDPCSFPVSYDDAKFVELIEPLIDRVIPAISLVTGRTREEVGAYMTHLKLAFTLGALHRNIYFKNSDYRAEAEYRFLELHPVHLPTPDVKTRRRNGIDEDVLYRELDWRRLSPEALKAVIIGPAVRDSMEAQQYALDALASTGLTLGSVPVLRSQRSYRSFKPRP